MKFFSTIFLLFLSFSAFSQAGTTVTFTDPVFGTKVLTFLSTDANGFHSYSNGESGFEEILLVFTGTRWEIQSENGEIFHFSDEIPGPNPPNLTIGSWQAGPASLGALTDFSGTGTAAVFPVDLVAFTAQVMDKNRVALSWNTASETNNDRFEVEASSTGEQFNLIGSVAGAGTRTEANEYTFYDESPGQGLRYYRLRQVDFDGTSDYSSVVSVELNSSSNGTMSIAPNPTSAGVVQLTYKASVSGEVNTEVFNMSGQKLLNQPQAVTEGQNNIALDLAGLKAGVYLVRVQVGNEVSSQRLVVK